MMIMWLFQYMIYIYFVHLSLWWISIVHSCPEKSKTTAQLPNLKITWCVLLTGVAIVGPWAWFRAGLQCLDKVSLKFIPKGPIHNNPALVEKIAWRRIGDKSLSELMLTRFTDVYIWHQEEMISDMVLSVWRFTFTDEAVMKLSFLYNGKSHIGKMTIQLNWPIDLSQYIVKICLWHQTLESYHFNIYTWTNSNINGMIIIIICFIAQHGFTINH